jgi:hypothetical protein
VYVDDCAISYQHDDEHSLYHDFTTALRKWEVEDEGELSDLLGVDFSNENGVVTLDQANYIVRMVEMHLPGGVSAAAERGDMPYKPSLKDHVVSALEQSPEDVDKALLKDYQRVVGALLYCATNTRPDVSYAVGMLCRAMSRPSRDLLLDAYRVLRYLHRTRHLGLRYEGSHRPLHGFSDSDWDVRHSTSGWVFILNSAAISWGSKKQKSVALSSCEAEIMAASEAGKEAAYLRNLCADLGMGDAEPTELSMDNRSAIDVAYNPEHHGRMKHVARRHFYVRELVEDHIIRCPFVSTVDNTADFFTKCLPPRTFRAMRDEIMNVPAADRDQATGGRRTCPGERAVTGPVGALRAQSKQTWRPSKFAPHM